MPVVSREDYEKAKSSGEPIKPRPFFNFPENVEEIIDPEKIKNKEYYLNFWDIVKNRSVDLARTFKAKNGGEINLKELTLATLLFRDLKGNPFRVVQDLEDVIVASGRLITIDSDDEQGLVVGVRGSEV